jgi:hypothetical protein
MSFILKIIAVASVIASFAVADVAFGGDKPKPPEAQCDGC